MSEIERMNEEALDAQQEYDKSQQESASVQNVRQEEQTKPRIRPGWETKDGEFFTFKNYHNLPAEYKVFLKYEQTKSKAKPDAPQEVITHVDPVDGRTYRYGVTIFDNGGSSVWSRLQDPNRPSGSGFKKSFYLDVGLVEVDGGVADGTLAMNETEREYRHKWVGSHVLGSVQIVDGEKKVVNKVVHIIVKQKRIEYGS